MVSPAVRGLGQQVRAKLAGSSGPRAQGSKESYRFAGRLPDELVLTEITEKGPVRKEDFIPVVKTEEGADSDDEDELGKRSVSKRRQW